MFEDLNPLDKTTATFEILIMLLVAFIIGFIIAWLIFRNRNSSSQSDSEDSNRRLRDDIANLNAKIAQFQTEKDGLKNDLDDCIAAKASLIAENSNKTVVDVTAADQEHAEKLGFKPASATEKEDLTKISGVGPFIEKKLNGLGIYTFDQISSFTPDTIERVTKAIEFFPGRIKRDNWVGQAVKFKSEN